MARLICFDNAKSHFDPVLHEPSIHYVAIFLSKSWCSTAWLNDVRNSNSFLSRDQYRLRCRRAGCPWPLSGKLGGSDKLMNGTHASPAKLGNRTQWGKISSRLVDPKTRPLQHCQEATGNQLRDWSRHVPLETSESSMSVPLPPPSLAHSSLSVVWAREGLFI